MATDIVKIEIWVRWKELPYDSYPIVSVPCAGCGKDILITDQHDEDYPFYPHVIGKTIPVRYVRLSPWWKFWTPRWARFRTEYFHDMDCLPE